MPSKLLPKPQPRNRGMSINGKEYKLGNGLTVTLYPISRLAKAFKDAKMPRSTQTIRLWLKRGLIPKPLFYNPADIFRPKSLWTMEQINVIVETMKEFEIRRGKNFEQELQDILQSRLEQINRQYF